MNADNVFHCLVVHTHGAFIHMASPLSFKSTGFENMAVWPQRGKPVLQAHVHIRSVCVLSDLHVLVFSLFHGVSACL